MLTISTTPNGDLLLQACNETRREIADLQSRYRSESSIMADLMESHSCNGSYTPFEPDGGDLFVGLTSAPCIADYIDCDDDGKLSLVGNVYYFANYMVRSHLDELKTKGRTVFQFGFEVQP
jgi:hypothetical protein